MKFLSCWIVDILKTSLKEDGWLCGLGPLRKVENRCRDVAYHDGRRFALQRFGRVVVEREGEKVGGVLFHRHIYQIRIEAEKVDLKMMLENRARALCEIRDMEKEE
jgi:hypothetical protein